MLRQGLFGRLGVAFGAVAFVFACSGDAPSKVSGAPTTPPDESYETDGALAWRVLVWKCTPRNERVAIYRRCAEGCTGCGKWEISRTLCPGDGLTPIESQIAKEGKGRAPIPAGHGWR